MTRPCSCGQIATQQIDVGYVLRGGTLRRAVTWMCDECAADSVREREIARSA